MKWSETLTDRQLYDRHVRKTPRASEYTADCSDPHRRRPSWIHHFVPLHHHHAGAPNPILYFRCHFRFRLFVVIVVGVFISRLKI